MVRNLVVVLCLLSVRLVVVSCDHESRTCEESVSPVVNWILSSATVHRRVDQELGVNSTECLNDTIPCRTLHYALRSVENQEERSSVRNLVIYLGPGTYVLTGSEQVIDSVGVALIGAGPDKTVFTCGEFGDSDRVCDYMNFQIRNSSYVYVTGILFTRCGPITSAVYVAFSDNIYFDNCVFQDTLSPSVLIHNTWTVVLDTCIFANNLPARLPPNITHNRCYFTGGKDLFFVDNRTTSGGISFYVEDSPTTFLLINCTFINNKARPDEDVSLVRRSESYGHGGAVNIRSLHSSN